MNLKKLALQNNKLKFIYDNFLTSFPYVVEIDITENICINMSYPTTALEVVEATIIDKCIAPIELNCKFEELHVLLEYSVENKGFTCNAADLNVEYPKTKISKLNGADSNMNVTVFKVIDQSIRFLPYQLAQVVPNLEKILIERSNLTSIHQHDFEGFSKLKTIEIRNNNLSVIHEAAFEDVTQLEHLDLSFNNIFSLPTKIFFRLVHLKTLILSNNQIEKFTANLLPRKNTIEKFCVNNNQLEIIETKTLRFLRKAKLIDLTGNVCIDLKFNRSEPESRTLVELSGEIDLNCSDDD